MSISIEKLWFGDGHIQENEKSIPLSSQILVSKTNQFGIPIFGDYTIANQSEIAVITSMSSQDSVASSVLKQPHIYMTSLAPFSTLAAMTSKELPKELELDSAMELATIFPSELKKLSSLADEFKNKKANLARLHFGLIGYKGNNTEPKAILVKDSLPCGIVEAKYGAEQTNVAGLYYNVNVGIDIFHALHGIVTTKTKGVYYHIASGLLAVDETLQEQSPATFQNPLYPLVVKSPINISDLTSGFPTTKSDSFSQSTYGELAEPTLPQAISYVKQLI